MRMILMLFCATYMLWAQESTTPNIEETLVVTGQFKPTTLMTSVIEVRVLDRETIDHRGAADLRELLASELQIDLSHHSVFGSSLSIGGVSGENLKILVDGAPMIGRLDGIIDLEQIGLGQVERVEIIQGPMSVFYGTDAFAGVINLITKSPGSERLAAEAKLDWRDLNDRRLDVAADLALGKHALRLSAGARDFDGHDEDASRRNQTWPERKQQNYSLVYSHYFNDLVARYRLAFADEASMELAQPNPTVYWDHDYATRRLDQQLGLNGALTTKLFLDLQLGHQQYDRTRDDIAISGGQPTGTVVRDPEFDTSFDTDYARALLSYELRAGDELQIGMNWNEDRGSGGRLNAAIAPLEERAVVLGYKFTGPKGLDIQPALRLADHSRYDVPLLPSLNLHQHTSFLEWRAGYSRGFRGPSIKQLYLDFSMYAGPSFYHIVGNPELDPETGEAYTLSFDKPLVANQLSLEGSYFYTQTHNLIQLSASIPDPNIPNAFSRKYINVSRQESQGGTLKLNWLRPIYQIHLGVGRNVFYNTLTNDGSLPTYNRSWDAQLEADVSLTQRISGHLNYSYNGTRPGYVSVGRPARIEEIRIEDWHGLDLTASWNTPIEGLKLGVGARNLLDVTDLNAVYAASGTAHATNQLDWGRSYQLTVTYHTAARP